ncbi:uncharacterized protein ARMOST_21289 [Armillaria ostoyae]|uniref:Uncharacterized protein n=1 Tax=Armillaria ostoyae TaxID=47428 RepID=A0A284S9N5_ARMOS|nr:uncharacterized protein ARMOST_21289 [Armillaria ostoyae]
MLETPSGFAYLTDAQPLPLNMTNAGLFILPRDTSCLHKDWAICLRNPGHSEPEARGKRCDISGLRRSKTTWKPPVYMPRSGT